jgi:hypothetical protein
VNGNKYELATNFRDAGGYDYGPESAPTGGTGQHKHSINRGGDAETRPKNAYVNWIIRFKQV